MLVAVIILGAMVVALALVLVWFLSRPKTVGSEASMLLKADMAQLNQSVEKLKDSLQKQLTEQLGQSNKQMAAQ